MTVIHIFTACREAQTLAEKRFQAARSRCIKYVKSLVEICQKVSKHAKQA